MACHDLVKCCKCSKVFPAFRCYAESRIIRCFNCKPVQWWVHCSLWFLSLLFFLWSPVPLMFVIVLFLVGPLPADSCSLNSLVLIQCLLSEAPLAFTWLLTFALVLTPDRELKPLEQTHSVLLSWVSSPSLLLGLKYFSAFTSLRGWLPSSHTGLFP